MDFIEKHHSPLLRREPLHELLRLPTAALRVGDHAVSGDADPRAVRLVFGIGREPTNLTVVCSAPHFELKRRRNMIGLFLAPRTRRTPRALWR